MRRLFVVFLLVLLCLALPAGVLPVRQVAAAAPASNPASLLNHNLIVNGDAESGAASPDGNTVVPVPGWTTTGNFTVVAYGTPGGFPTTTDPGPFNRAKNFFAGGPNNAQSSATQSIDISGLADLIDQGVITYTFQDWLGGYSSQSDSAVLDILLFDAGGQALSDAKSKGPNATERENKTGFVQRYLNLPLLRGARRIEINLTMQRELALGATYNDGYADSMSLVLTTAVSQNCTPASTSPGTTVTCDVQLNGTQTQNGKIQVSMLAPAGAKILACNGKFVFACGSITTGPNNAVTVTCINVNCSAGDTFSLSLTSPSAGALTEDLSIAGFTGNFSAVLHLAGDAVWQLRGDVNGDSVVSAVDALCLLRSVAGLPATANCPSPLTSPDVNGDGQVTALDALCVLRMVANLPATANCP